MEFEIIDFHTHPFLKDSQNICWHNECCKLNPENFKAYLENMGVSKICGSVIRDVSEGEDIWDVLKECNDDALKIKEIYKDFYVPGFHVHPNYVKQSCEEIERMHSLGINLVGELVPYMYQWDDYSCKEFYEILDLIDNYRMVVNYHSMGLDQMDKMVKDHKNIKFIAAHPGKTEWFLRHMERMKFSENYYLDISGTGIERHGFIRQAVETCGAERIIYGSDFPVCNPSSYLGAVYFEQDIKDSDKELIFSKNIKRILGI